MNSIFLSRHQHWPVYMLAVVYLLSGGTGLAYEILWTRMLSLQFGVSIFGVVATIAAFMLGLGLGSLCGLRLLRHVTQPLRVFAILELFVALSAVLIPSLFRYVDGELSSLAGQLELSTWFVLQISVVMLVLTIPALAMGAGFPMVLAVLKQYPQGLGVLYGMNALGGAAGALLPLLLLPLLGWLSALYVVAAIGLGVAVFAWYLSPQLQISSDVTNTGDEAVQKTRFPAPRWLLIYGGIGAAALLLEIGWTRLFGMVLLRTEYVLAIILAVFLLGIGLGSLLARLLLAKRWLTILPVLAGLFAVLSLWWFPGLASWAERAQFDSLFEALLQQGLMITLLTLPVTVVLGAWLPLYATTLGAEHQSGVWLYGANSIGAALGTLVAGFILIPMIGTAATIIAGAMILMVLGLSWAPSGRAWVAAVIVGLLAVPVVQMPEVNQLLPTAHASARTLSLHEDAIAITHVVEGADGQRQLLADLRRMDASSDPTAVTVQKNQVRLPLILHQNPETLLLLGLGTGISASASLSYPLLERTAVEISQGAIMAARDWFEPVNGGVMAGLEMVRDDARHFLMSDAGLYDVIVGDLFHPDLVGRSALLSRQQFERARQRLNKDGIFVQWLALNQFDLDSLQVVLATFKQAFPDAVMFVDAFRLAMVGTKDEPITLDNSLQNLQRLEAGQRNRITGGEGPWSWLGRYWGRIPQATQRIQDEWSPIIEYRLPGARYRGDLDLVQILTWLQGLRPTASVAATDLQVADWDMVPFSDAYEATTLIHQSWIAMMNGRGQLAQNLLPQAYEANPEDRWVGFALADAVLADRTSALARGLNEQQLLETVLKIRPDHAEALRGLLGIAQQAGDAEAMAKYRARLVALSPLDRVLKAVNSELIPSAGNDAARSQ